MFKHKKNKLTVVSLDYYTLLKYKDIEPFIPKLQGDFASSLNIIFPSPSILLVYLVGLSTFFI